MYTIVYHIDVTKIDIPKLDTEIKIRIKRAIEDRLITEPEVFGKPLRTSLRGYRKLRVGEYRVIFYVQKKEVRVLAIMHRSVVYGKVLKR